MQIRAKITKIQPHPLKFQVEFSSIFNVKVMKIKIITGKAEI